MAVLDVLIPTMNRPLALALTLAGVAGQSLSELRVVVADQSDEPMQDHTVLRTLARIIEARGGMLEWHHRLPRHGIAEQRQFLLDQATSRHCLFLDDDVFMEPWVAAKLHEVLCAEACGFVGAFPNGMSFVEDVRPDQQQVEFWSGPVRPEVVEPGSKGWERAKLHAAANLYHAGLRLAPGEVRRYKVAWVGACCLYDRTKLEAVGGFGFWRALPSRHAGEEVLVQNLLMRRWGGCALMPSGTYHAEVPTTIGDEARTPAANAISLLPRMLERGL
ncbi:MAG TPA: glycosyltransferase [Trueperaceae bacterium]